MNPYGQPFNEIPLHAYPSGYTPLLASHDILPTTLYGRMNNSDEASYRDIPALSTVFTAASTSPLDSVASQLFGHQARQTRMSLDQILGLLYERNELHQRHIRDIQRRNLHTQERLFGARLHGRMDGYKNALKLEQMLAQLEEQQRKEELQFWKDRAEMSLQLLEASGEYASVRQRMALFEGLEAPGGTYHA